ncbi:MAG: DEAD/DEAH box helicase [Nanoarchaeota archaeon]
MESFTKLGLSEKLAKALSEFGFEQPREIQEKTIPLAMAGKDIIGGSATGSGKTLAFGASIIEKTIKGKGVQALILTPTRELAEQVADSLIKFSRYYNLEICTVYGGVSIEPQMRYLRYADVVVGTPGRILDHLERRTLDLSKVKTLVLDEADRMLDMGFIDDVVKIIESCPKERQTMLFSATISRDIELIAKKYMKKPESIELESYVDPSKLKQVYYDASQDVKFSLLLHLLKHEHPGLIMIFCNTQRNTDFIADNLARYSIDATAIHGGLSQAKRTRVMDNFRNNQVSVLVCTDVAARGLDIKNVSHVYNYDMPNSSKEYVHRIGRTARAGKDGIAINLVSPRDYDNFRSILRNPELQIEQMPIPEVEKVFVNFNSPGRERSFRPRMRSSGNGRSFGDRSEGSGESRGGYRGGGERGGSRGGGGYRGGGGGGGYRGGSRSRHGRSNEDTQRPSYSRRRF